MSIMNTNQIQSYLHCGLCFEEIKKLLKPELTNEERSKYSPRNYQQLEVGWTAKGIQVWCKRHDCNMLHIDFEEHTHPADSTRQKTLKEMT